jgi:hypothetical protein
MGKIITGKQNYYKLLLNDLYKPGYYQRYLGVEPQTNQEIDDYFNKIKSQQPEIEDKEPEIIYERIVKKYPRVLYIKNFTKLLRVVYKPNVPEVVTLE